MTSQGQRFRRRALRRGYKVDEVDVFLDRVEATLNGERVSSPVRSQEVRDVVFRVRFGGYDEWQVDLHLDRVERQLADQEPANGFVPERMGAGERLPDRMPPDRQQPDRMPERLPERLPGNPGLAGAGMGGPGGGSPHMGHPNNPNPGMGGPGMPPGMGAAAAFDRDRPPTGVSQRDLPPRDQSIRDDRMMPPPNRPNPNTPPPGWPEPPQRPAPGGGYPPQGYAERPPTGPSEPLPQRPVPQDYGNEPPSFSGFEVGRRERPDMTSEMRLGGPSAGMPPAAPPHPHMPPPNAPPHMGGMVASNVPVGEVQRIDQLRRTFQLRRFGSGYDRAEVDRLFEGIINAMSGRSTMPIDESELDPHQFSLVPGGYFESEVDQALREVRDIIRRR